MAELKSLAKDTAIYGASSIIGKFLNSANGLPGTSGIPNNRTDTYFVCGMTPANCR